MSMTREEAIEFLSQYIDNECYTEKCQEAHRMAISALRPVSREQVERMRGEWRSIHGLSEYYCSRCGEEFEIHAYDKEKYRFCPHCMAPMTDEAVQMVMERLEALKDG
jgi:hypothetical protein